MKAVDSCIQKGIPEEFLRENQAEVLHMLLTECDEKAYDMKITDRTIDGGTPFDWGKTSLDYADKRTYFACLECKMG